MNIKKIFLLPFLILITHQATAMKLGSRKRPRTETPRIAPNAGNHNDSSSCFLNAACQALYYISSFREFMNATPKGQSATLDLLRDHFICMQVATEPKHVNTEEYPFRDVICEEINQEDMQHGQHDAHEFLDSILNNIRNELVKNDSDLAINMFDQLIIISIKQKIAHDKHVVHTEPQKPAEADKMIPLPLTKPTLLECCSDHFGPAEIKKYECPVCQSESGDRSKRVDATQLTTITSTPQLLIVQLKCFGHKNIDDTMVPYKKDDIISIPDELHFANGIYHIKAFVVHDGNSPSNGHYWTYAHTSDGWYCYNDTAEDRAQKVDELIVKMFLGKDVTVDLGDTRAYLLFFEKIGQA